MLSFDDKLGGEHCFIGRCATGGDEQCGFSEGGRCAVETRFSEALSGEDGQRVGSEARSATACPEGDGGPSFAGTCNAGLLLSQYFFSLSIFY